MPLAPGRCGSLDLHSTLTHQLNLVRALKELTAPPEDLARRGGWGPGGGPATQVDLRGHPWLEGSAPRSCDCLFGTRSAGPYTSQDPAHYIPGDHYAGKVIR